MNFSLNEEQKMLQESVRRLVQEKLMPIANDFGENDYDLCWDIIKIMAKQGMLGAHIPEEYGGSSRPGFESLAICLIREQLASCSPAELVFAVNGLGSYPLVVAGSDEQRKMYLPQVAQGKKLFSFALTEPDAGSDVAGMKTRAVLDGSDYVINGSKTFISNAGISDVYVVFAKTDLTKGTRGISAFIVEKGTPGLEFGKKMRLLAPHPIGELFFTDCRIPRENILGQEGEGFKIAMKTLDVYRQSVGAFSVGVAQKALDLSVDYAKQRIAFGKPIGENQGIQYKLSDMAVGIAAARLLVYNAAWLKDNNLPFTQAASIAKLYATEMAQQVTYQAQQIFGGYGVVKEYQVEQLYRQIRASALYEGTSEIQRVVIARHLMRD